MLYKVYKNGQIVEGLLIDCNPEKSVENMIKFMNLRDIPLINKTKSGGLIYLNPLFENISTGKHLFAIDIYELEEVEIC